MESNMYNEGYKPRHGISIKVYGKLNIFKILIFPFKYFCDLTYFVTIGNMCGGHSAFEHSYEIAKESLYWSNIDFYHLNNRHYENYKKENEDKDTPGILNWICTLFYFILLFLPFIIIFFVK